MRTAQVAARLALLIACVCAKKVRQRSHDGTSADVLPSPRGAGRARPGSLPAPPQLMLLTRLCWLELQR